MTDLPTTSTTINKKKEMPSSNELYFIQRSRGTCNTMLEVRKANSRKMA
ncbi:Uncharacterised protein [Vibrio cholerae]|nr:Uncharacterised protein [Vibrio cholerae]CSI58062.1 Uncharacterised protein [Vibrio cholerae]